MSYSSFYARSYTVRTKMAVAFGQVWHLPTSRLYLLIAGLLQVLAWIQAIFIWRNLSGDLLVLHYNVDFGVDLVGSPARIFTYPLFGLAVIAVNLVIASALNRHKDFKVFTQLLLATAALVSIFLCLVLLSIYFINFR